MTAGKKIFIVDDEPTIVEYVTVILEKASYQVSSCENGTDAIEKIRAEKPDLILLDVMLPDVDGITICRQIKSNPKTNAIPVILLTSLTDATTIRDAQLFGVSDYISKPFDAKVLKAKIEKALSKRPAE